MGLSGFTIVRNGERLGYPFVESLESLAPFVDEIVVALGNSDDNSEGILNDLAKRLPLKIFHSPWNQNNTSGGSELARQSNLALERCQNDLCFYLQADEVLNDTEAKILKEDLVRFDNDPTLDALALKWIHFYGNFETIVESRQWYRFETRVIRKSRGCRSYGDAQGFRIPKPDGTFAKPRAALSRAHVHHYGWVRPPKTMAQKSEALDRLWHGSKRDGTHHEENVYPPLFGMKTFKGTHPQVMQKRIREFGSFNPFTNAKVKRDLRYYKLASTALIESVSGWRPGEFRNFQLVKSY